MENLVRSATTDSGITVEDAIHKIENVNIHLTGKSTFLARIYVKEGLPSFHEVYGEFDYVGGNAFEEAMKELSK